MITFLFVVHCILFLLGIALAFACDYNFEMFIAAAVMMFATMHPIENTISREQPKAMFYKNDVLTVISQDNRAYYDSTYTSGEICLEFVNDRTIVGSTKKFSKINTECQVAYER